VLRWTAAATVVLTAHGTAIWIALNWETAQAAPGDPPAAIMMELSPLAVAPETAIQNLAPGPQMTEAKPASEPSPIPEPDIKVPELPQQKKEEAIVARPPLPEEPKPTPTKRETERKKPVERDKPKAQRTTAPTASANPRPDRTSAPAVGAASTPSMSQASWESSVFAHIIRYTRFPPGGAAGVRTAVVSFTIGRSGQVLSAHLSRSSGDSILDQEAVALVHRASPVPAPPLNTRGGSISIDAPVRFNQPRG
jgi:protein TonB